MRTKVTFSRKNELGPEDDVNGRIYFIGDREDDDDAGEIYLDGKRFGETVNRKYVQTTGTVQGNMGYLVLKKNQDFKTQVEDVSEGNTIFEIRYDYDLGGQTVTIPENCVLKFEGGSISNGTIVGNNSTIKSDILKIFGDIHLGGYYSIENIPVEWFGAIGNDENVDNTDAINNTVSEASNINALALLSSMTYYCNDTINVVGSGSGDNNKRCGLIGAGLQSKIYSKSSSVAVYAAGGRCIVSNLTITRYADYVGTGLLCGSNNTTNPCTRGLFENLWIFNFGIGMNTRAMWCCVTDNITIRLCYIGIQIETLSTDLKVEKCTIESCRDYAVYVPNSVYHLSISTNVIEGNGQGIVIVGGHNITISDNYFEENTEYANIAAGYIESSTKDAFGIDVVGGHVLIGQSTGYVTSVTISNNYFDGALWNDVIPSPRNGFNNQIAVDKCFQLNLFGNSKIAKGMLKLGANCHVKQSDIVVNSNFAFEGVPYLAKQSVPPLAIGKLKLQNTTNNGYLTVKPFGTDDVKLVSNNPFYKQATGAACARNDSDASDRYVDFVITNYGLMSGLATPVIAMDYFLDANAPDYAIKLEAIVCKSGTETTLLTKTRDNCYNKGVVNRAMYKFTTLSSYATGFEWFKLRLTITNESEWESRAVDLAAQTFAIRGIYIFEDVDTDFSVNNGEYKLLPVHTLDVNGSVSLPTSVPVNPKEGMIYYNTTDKKCLLYNGDAWTNLDGTALSI